MQLVMLHDQPWRPSSPLGVLTAILRLRGLLVPGLATQDNLDEARARVAWPDDWSNALFVPPRTFEARQKARRFLKWLAGRGVDVGPWLDHLDDRTGSMSSPPPPYHGGYVGRAYLIGDKVVKFTTDKNEAGLAAAIEGQDSPHLATVYGVATVGEVCSLVAATGHFTLLSSSASTPALV
jgi:hypothetical protein